MSIFRARGRAAKAITNKWNTEYDQYIARKMKPLNPREEQQVKRLIRKRQETKFFVLPTATYSQSTTAAVTGISAIPEGDTDNERNGDKLQWVKSIRLKYTIRTPSYQAMTQPAYNVRVIVFQWKEESTPAPGDILLTGPSTVVDWLSFYSWDKKSLYTILYDRTHVLSGNGFFDTTADINTPSTTTSAITRSAVINIKKAKKDAQFLSGTVTGINKFWVLTISDSTVSPHPNITMDTQVFFTDS